MDIKVFEQAGQLWTASREVAEKFGKRHDTVLRAITNTRRDCSTEFNARNFAEATYQDAKGETRPMILLSRGGFSMVAMGFTGREAVAWKEKFIAAFDAMEKRILHLSRQAERRAAIDWQAQRHEGKAVRRIETDAIKEFVEYAKDQGSANAGHYYSNITSMAYRGLFLLEKGLEKHFPASLREYLDVRQLLNLSVAEGAVEKALRDGMDQGLPYKEIYLLAKDRVAMLVMVVGRTHVLPLPQQQQAALI